MSPPAPTPGEQRWRQALLPVESTLQQAIRNLDASGLQIVLVVDAGGALAGTGAAGYSSRNLQQRYDYSYQQCMYAKGHKIPMAATPSSRYERPRRYRDAVPPPPPPPRG